MLTARIAKNGDRCTAISAVSLWPFVTGNRDGRSER